MSSRKRLGYNWKARQQKGNVKVRSRSLKINGNGVDVESSYSPSAPFRGVLDTNVEVLPSKKRKLDDAEDGDAMSKVVYKRKLSGKQRKHLLKVIEVKKRKAKVIPIKAPRMW